MKHLIILVLLIMAINVQCQNYKMGASYPTGKGIFIVPNYRDSIYYPEMHYDTNKIMMLFCDTSRKININHVYIPKFIEEDTIYIQTFKKDTTLSPYNQNMYWAVGYEVIETTINKQWERQYIGELLINIEGYSYYKNKTFIKYLDKNKKEIPKNIVIWQSINIK